MRLPLPTLLLRRPFALPPRTLLQSRTYATETVTIPASTIAKPQTPAPDANPTTRGPPEGLAYRITRTHGGSLPVYNRTRAGNKIHTMIRRVEGDSSKLRDEVQELLHLPGADVAVNPATGHVIVKGRHQKELKEFLEKRGF